MTLDDMISYAQSMAPGGSVVTARDDIAGTATVSATNHPDFSAFTCDLAKGQIIGVRKEGVDLVTDFGGLAPGVAETDAAVDAARAVLPGGHSRAAAYRILARAALIDEGLWT